MVEQILVCDTNLDVSSVGGGVFPRSFNGLPTPGDGSDTGVPGITIPNSWNGLTPEEKFLVCDSDLDEQGYAPNAILFDGATDLMLRGAGLTGIADGKQGLLSCWFRRDAGSLVTTIIFDSDGTKTAFVFNSLDQISVIGLPVGGGQVFNITTNGTFTADGIWKHLLSSWNAATDTYQLRINDVSDVGTISFNEDFIDYTRVDWAFGGDVGGTLKYTGAIADPYFTTEFLDTTVVANSRKFIDANGDPVFLGNAGELPTGTSPFIYLRGNQTDQGINSGSGGDFVSQGVQVPDETPGPVVDTSLGTFPRSFNGLPEPGDGSDTGVADTGVPNSWDGL